jgi:hypothetical protein
MSLFRPAHFSPRSHSTARSVVLSRGKPRAELSAEHASRLLNAAGDPGPARRARRRMDDGEEEDSSSLAKTKYSAGFLPPVYPKQVHKVVRDRTSSYDYLFK